MESCPLSRKRFNIGAGSSTLPSVKFCIIELHGVASGMVGAIVNTVATMAIATPALPFAFGFGFGLAGWGLSDGSAFESTLSSLDEG